MRKMCVGDLKYQGYDYHNDVEVYRCPKCGYRQKRDSDYYNNTENRRTKIGSYAIEQS